MINELISKFPDEDAFLSLLLTFDKLLKKYAKMLEYEDAYEELRLFLIELIYDIKRKEAGSKNDGAVVRYISTAVKNKYIALSKKKKMEDAYNFSNLSDEQIAVWERITATEDRTDISYYFPIRDGLTDHEREILHLLIDCGYTANEIAVKYKISRQAVNKTKLRALNKIRKALCE